MMIGHQRQIRYLSRVLANGRVAHAYLFAGPESVGKKTAAVEFAKGLLCGNDPFTFGGCGQCQACRDAEGFLHPDVILLARDLLLIPEEEKKGIGIRNIQEISRRLSLSAWAGGWRVVIIDGAEAMSRAASSALLKLLEEPGRETIFFLITATPGGLLETIRSRCVPVRFSPLGDAELEEGILGMKEVKHLNIQSVTALARGRPGLALRFLREPTVFQERRAAKRKFEDLFHRGLDEQFRFAEAALTEGAALKSFFEFVLYALRERVIRQLTPAGRTLSLLRIAATAYQLLESTTVNRRLLADAFFVELYGLQIGTNMPITHRHSYIRKDS